MQLLSVALTMDGDWTGLDWALPRLCTPQGLKGSIPWRTCYKVARSKQGIIASLSLTCSNTAVAELTMGSNTPPTDSTKLGLTMQHKSGTAQIWHDNLLKNSNRQPLLICTRCQAQDNLAEIRRSVKLNVSKREIDLVKVKYYSSTVKIRGLDID